MSKLSLIELKGNKWSALGEGCGECEREQYDTVPESVEQNKTKCTVLSHVGWFGPITGEKIREKIPSDVEFISRL